MTSFVSFLPELVLLAGALALFVVTLGQNNVRLARILSVATASGVLVAALATVNHSAVLFSGAYRVDAFSQLLKIAIAFGYLCVGILSGQLRDIRGEAKPEYFLFLALSMTGLLALVSSIDVITLIIALELSSFPLYLMVAMRREREGQRVQMESAIKYIMFGIAANGVMFFGFGYLYGLTGSTSLPVILEKLPPLLSSPLAVTGLALTLAGFLYKLAVFPFHFWTPDVYQGSSNETASLIASLPKLGAVAVLVRFVSLAAPGHETLATLLTCLAIASMVYGNLIALVQTDLKRLLGFSGIAHAGYVMVGFVAMDNFGFASALYYIAGYMLMVLACFVVVCQVSRDGANVAITELAGLHKRSPLLAVTLIVGVFALAGVPPFVGFMAKLNLLTSAWQAGHTALVVLTVINSAIAIYYYLQIVRAAFFAESDAQPAPIALTPSMSALCVLLIVAITLLGVAPAFTIDAITNSLATISTVSS
ncbi:NADH-quinone oxidoreductase subunit N [Opitutus terrae]|uniref:NADH-quinone oxidoreductase subunit N 2 n=1 Tax=Opitutus terrae (strain DSM 11246 / JCM 15787 / PB90-1) TaxID=452637 RepID=NUON2_OPITP|nr:NADH-quinone oxidoreductase subunit N [Opitutus terrae]B1ZUK1.1 RecName: Full=NADH-quinone oxidoreductase subunit N 2; AltName: Full=NADH dehydrogenase I subunit N 2; AltName: Full=NDH-1 subunit N 2 [Opitutus terrae PB90-1]ACB74044.1 proton-translocating NADH-quinone oxidoreductase, chain N [Opitutus terrae PB90-1]